MARTESIPELPPDAMADAQLVADCVAAGRPIPPKVARRVEERAKQTRGEIVDGRDIGVQLIREARGPLDEDQERELTLTQRDLLRRGEVRLTDPDTGTTYVLVPADEYERLRGLAR